MKLFRVVFNYFAGYQCDALEPVIRGRRVLACRCYCQRTRDHFGPHRSIFGEFHPGRVAK